MPVPKVPSWGDSARLAQLASGLKREHGTYGAVVQRNEVGRPSAPPSPPREAPLPAEHMQAAREMARAEWVRQFWAGMAQRYPDDALIEMYAANADRLAARRSEEFYASMPNYEW